MDQPRPEDRVFTRIAEIHRTAIQMSADRFHALVARYRIGRDGRCCERDCRRSAAEDTQTALHRHQDIDTGCRNIDMVALNGGDYVSADSAAYGMDSGDLKLWFGILALVVVELGLITPPVGLNVFIIASLAKDVPIIETFKGVMPFFAVEILRIGLLLALPGLVLWLPSIL